MTPRSRTLCATLVALVLGGCGDRGGPRLPPFPTFDPRQPFADATVAPAAARDASDAFDAADPSFEDALRASYGGGDEATPAAPAVATEAVPLAGRLVSVLPRGGEDWTWSADETSTLVVHRTGGRVDAMIYAEAWSDLVRSFPSAEHDRFLRTVAPELASSAMAIARGLLDVPIAQIASGAGLSVTAARRAWAALETRTLGRGVGFQPDEQGFRGWRYLGRNAEGVEIRLARVDGRWGPQSPLPEEVVKLLDHLRETTGTSLPSAVTSSLSGTPTPAGTPALLLLGSATPGSLPGIHLALLCPRPECPVEDDIVTFLDRLRPSATGDPSSTHSSELRARAHELGLQFLSTDTMRPLLEAAPTDPTVPKLPSVRGQTFGAER